MRPTVFRVLSRVPRTKPFRDYRDTVRWCDETVAFVQRAMPPGEQMAFPKPIPRHPAALSYAVGSLLALLKAVESLGLGNDYATAAAVLAEHSPESPWRVASSEATGYGPRP